MKLNTMTALMKYPFINALDLFQERYNQEADTNFPNSRAAPINPTVTGAPGKMAINPVIDITAAIELINNADKNVNNIIVLNVFDGLDT
jgi:hypothetical protein